MEHDALGKEHIARKLALGQILDIQLQDVEKTRFQGPLLGMKEGKYLMTDLPSLTRHGNLRDLLLDEQELIVRTICEKTTGECLGFKSHIVSRLKLPDHLLFITFPPEVQIHELRNESRLVVHQKARLALPAGNDAVFGIVTDFSASGCRFEMEVGERHGHAFKRDDKMEIEFNHPEDGRPLKFGTDIRSVRTHGTVMTIGMVFVK